MEIIEYYLVLLALFLLIIYIYQQLVIKKRDTEEKNLPPSPPSLPIIGHFHLLKPPLQQTLNTLSKKYGPVFLLRLGSRRMLVVSSRSAIEECLTKNDIIFANRPLLPSRKISTYNFSALGATSYGNHWRSLRRFFALEVFSAKRLQMSSDIRNEEIRFMIKHLSRGVLGEVVDVKLFVYMLAYNIMMRMVAGNRCFGEEEIMDIDNKAKGKLDYYKQIFDPSQEMALGDFIPFLRWLTYFGVEKKMLKAHKKRDALLQALIDTGRNNNSNKIKSTHHGGQNIPTLIDVLLKLQESDREFYTDTVIKGIIQALPKGGAHTTVITMEAVITRLVSHPHFLNKARDQIDNLVGRSRLLADADLAKLPYLQCIINETLRLISSAGILGGHESSEECTVAGYSIPPGTQLLINRNAVHRDPELWIEPDKFEPERFLDYEEQKGRCKFLPFGSGRRQCPGISLAMRILPLLLGTLIQCFDWEKAKEESNGVVKTKLNNSDDDQEKSVNKIIFPPREALSKVLAQL